MCGDVQSSWGICGIIRVRGFGSKAFLFVQICTSFKFCTKLKTSERVPSALVLDVCTNLYKFVQILSDVKKN